MNVFNQTGRYFALLAKVFSKPERHSLYVRQIFNEIDNLGVKSVGIVTVISIFMGGITTLQVAYNMSNPLLPTYLIGLGNRDTLILEFSSTILGLIMAGKIGSNITSEIGSMKVTEQIDSLEIMGVNSAGYLILPKIVAVVLMFLPMLVINGKELGYGNKLSVSGFEILANGFFSRMTERRISQIVCQTCG